MNEMNELLRVLQQLVEDTGEEMPGWSLPIDAYTYVCSYCGVIAGMDAGMRETVQHDKECPVHKGLRLLKKHTPEGGIPQIMTADILTRWIASANVPNMTDIYQTAKPNVFYATFAMWLDTAQIMCLLAFDVEVIPVTGIRVCNGYLLKWHPPEDDER